MYRRPKRCARQWPVVIALVFAVIPLAWAGDFVAGGPCTRGRVTLNGRTIISDWGTLLRMACWSLDMQMDNPSRDELKTIKECGVNALHVYFERCDEPYARGRMGHNVEKMDELVEWCRQESLYVVMTIGGSIVGEWNDGMAWELDSIRKIWEIYAPRYADQTHVIYEIKNEGCNGTFHCDEPVMQMYHDMYMLIREKAPKTHILMMSHSNLAGGTASLMEDVERLGPDIDWTNASFAFHGYAGGGGAGGSGEFQEQVIYDMSEQGYGMTMTECWPNRGLEGYYERAQISYMPMVGCFGPMASQKCSAQRSLGLSYAPDFGSWPQQHVEHISVAAKAASSPARRRAAAGRSAVVFPIVTSRLLRGDIQAVYDLSGRLLWHRGGGASGTHNGRAAPIARGLMSRPLLVKYADRPQQELLP
jgi:hypothetical protein